MLNDCYWKVRAMMADLSITAMFVGALLALAVFFL